MVSIGSYSLDCYGPQFVAYRPTHSRSTSATQTTEKKLAPSSSQASKSSTSTTSNAITSTPPTPSSTSSHTLPLNSIDPYSHIYATSPASTPSPSPTSTNAAHSSRSSDRTNLSTAGEIALGVVIPTIGVIVAIIFGVRMWNRGGLK